MIEIPLSKTSKKHAGKFVAFVDNKDKELAAFNWTVEYKEGRYTQYAYRKIGKQTIWMHRVVLSRSLERELNPSELVDHKNRNGLDNRRRNVRIATPGQNGANKPMAKRNKAGKKGVYLYRNGKYRAQIHHNKKTIYLGQFDDLDKAHEAYCRAADLYHKKFANYG